MWIDDLTRLLPRDLPVRGTADVALQPLEQKLGRELPPTYRQFMRWAGDTAPPFLILAGYDLSFPAILASYDPITFRRTPTCMRIGLSTSPDRFDLFLGLDGDDPPVFMAETHTLPDDEGYLLAHHLSELLAFSLFDREVLGRSVYHLLLQLDVRADNSRIVDDDDMDAFVHRHLKALGYTDLPPNRQFFLMERGDTSLAYHRLPDSLAFSLFIGAPSPAAAEELQATLPTPVTVSPVPVERS